MRTFASDLLTDLREKKLLPVVIVLLAALVAIPLLLSNDPEPEPVRAAPAGTDELPVVPTVEDSEPGGAAPAGGQSDPFRPKGTGAVSERGTSPTASVPPPPPSSPPARTTPPTTTTPPAPPVTRPGGTPGSTTATPAPELVTTYRATVSHVEAGRTETITNPARYLPFPDDTTNPAVMYYGAAADGDSAYFLTGPGVARVEGARCLPARSECTIVELEPGQSVRVTRLTPGRPRIARIRLVALARTSLPAAQARREAARASDLGRCIAGPTAALDLTAGGALSARGPSPAACRRLLRRVGP